MNDARRTIIAKAVVLIDDAKALLEQVQNDEQTAFDNLPESLQSSARALSMEDGLSTLEEKIDELDALRADLNLLSSRDQ